MKDKKWARQENTAVKKILTPPAIMEQWAVCKH